MGHDANGRGGNGDTTSGTLGRVLDRNVAALLERRRAQERARTRQERIAEWLGRFAGSMTFVWIHAAVVVAWVGMNVGLIPGPRFDADFVKLATAASVEAIFLSTFVLVTQNRMAAAADQRADLDLQISLLAEHELTRLIRLADQMARRLGVDPAQEADLGAIEQDVHPEEVLDRIEKGGTEEGAPEPRGI